MFIDIKSFKVLPIFLLNKEVWKKKKKKKREFFSHLIVMKNHFKAIKVKILSSFLLLQISKFIFGFIAKRIETLVWIEQQTCRCLHSGVALVTSPFFIHVNTFFSIFVIERKCKPTKRCAKVNCYHSDECNRSGEEKFTSLLIICWTIIIVNN